MYSLAEAILIFGFISWMVRTWLFEPIIGAVIITIVIGDMFAVLIGGPLREELAQHPLHTWVILGVFSAIPYLPLFGHIRRFLRARREAATNETAIK